MNRSRWIVSNTGPLISLEKLSDGHDFIRLLYDKILIPYPVLEELTMGQSPAESYLEHYSESAALALLRQLRRAGRISRRMHQELAGAVAAARGG